MRGGEGGRERGREREGGGECRRQEKEGRPVTIESLSRSLTSTEYILQLAIGSYTQSHGILRIHHSHTNLLPTHIFQVYHGMLIIHVHSKHSFTLRNALSTIYIDIA